MLIDFDEPLVVMMMGFSGSGKSYVARHLGKKNNYSVLSSDRIRAELNLKGNYSKEAVISVYEKMIKTAVELLRKGSSVVLDATFIRYRYRKLCYRNIRSFPIHMVECRVHREETIIKRLRARKLRKSGISEADVDVYLLQKSQYEPIDINDLRHLSSILTIFND